MLATPSNGRAAQQRWREMRRAWYRTFMDGQVCEICGGSGPRLEWHHRDPTAKAFSIGAVGRYSTTSVLAEIAKCRLLCACCHRREHGKRPGRATPLTAHEIESIQALDGRLPQREIALRFNVSPSAVSRIMTSATGTNRARKLPPNAVVTMRAMAETMTQSDIGRCFGVSQAQVSRTLRGVH